VWHQSGYDEGFDMVAVASFDGNCSADELMPLRPTTGVSRAFGDTALGRDRQVQPFFHVDCDHIIRTLRPSLDHFSVPMRRVIFGRALARVITHELYHIIARTTEHAESGVAKPSFSSEDLMTERFDFSHASIERLLVLRRAVIDRAYSAQKLTFTAN